MTTPQDTLYRLQERIRHLTDLFESDENGGNIFDTVKLIELKMADIVDSQQRQEDLMNLIVKLLGKHADICDEYERKHFAEFAKYYVGALPLNETKKTSST